MLQKFLLPAYRLAAARWVDRLAVGLASILVVSAIQRVWVHPSGGHTHRQSDTIGMSIAFAEQVRERGIAALDFLVYPRVLQRGLLDGINASEFPLINVVGGSAFLLSRDPWIGVFLTSLLILLLNLYAAYACLPRLLRAWNIELNGPICLLLWFTGASLANQSSVIMPEGIAFPLVVIGMVRLLESRHSLSALASGALLCNLGIATKPTAVIALGAIAVLPLVAPERRTQWKGLLLGCLLSLAFPAWWYTAHARHLLSFAQGPQIFALAAFDPLARLREVGLGGLLWLLAREASQGQLPMFVGGVFVVAGALLGEWVPVILYLLSLVAATSLDGAHIYVHSYYFVGTSVFAIVLMARVLGAVQYRRALRALTIALLAWGALYNIRGNVWVWARDSQYWRVSFWNMGAEARKLIPDGYHLVTDDGLYPQKLLYVGRSGSPAGANAYQLCSQTTYSTLPLAIVSDTPPPSATSCGGRPAELKTVSTPFASWHVTLVR